MDEATPGRLLIVDDDEMTRDMLVRRLAHRGYEASAVSDAAAALSVIRARELDLVLLDVMMPDVDGFALLASIRSIKPPTELPVVMATARRASEDVVEALGRGANDYVTKPFDFSVLLARIETQVSLKRAVAEVLRLERRCEDLELAAREGASFIVGQSRAMTALLERIDMVGPTGATVLVLGESGTGKELVAQEIHRRSRRRAGPLVRVNCASVPRELYESEFFGHTRGAFTGAVKTRIGRFELADRGTLFLDEVGEIPLDLQSKLLRVLQTGEYERVGEETTRSVDVRIVAATNRRLEDEVRAGRFRADLFYRLNVFPIVVPPLRERLEDVPLLARAFLEQAARRLNRPGLALDPNDLERLSRYDWPGNVRELENVIERAVITARNGSLTFEIGTGAGAGIGSVVAQRALPAGPGSAIVPDAEMVERVRRNLVSAMEQAGWRIRGPGGAAELLGLKPTTLASRLKSFRIERPEERDRSGRVILAGPTSSTPTEPSPSLDEAAEVAGATVGGAAGDAGALTTRAAGGRSPYDGQIAIRPLTLTFRDPRLERAFWTQLWDEQRENLNSGLALVVVLVAGFGLTDTFIIPDEAAGLTAIRAIALAPFLVVLGVVYSRRADPFLREHHQEVALAVIGHGVIWLTIIARRLVEPFDLVHVTYVAMAYFTFQFMLYAGVRLRFVYSCLIGGLTFVLACVVLLPLRSTHRQVVENLIVFATVLHLLGAYVAYRLGHYARLDFLARVRMRDELALRRRIEEELLRARDQAEDAARLKSSFLATMSHELQDPLNSIIGYTELIEELAEGESERRFVPDLQRIRRAAGHLRELIDDVLDLSKLEAGSMLLSLVSFDVRELVREVAEVATPLAAQTENRFVLSVGEDLGEIVADRAKLRQVLLNLLGNAFKFTAHGDVELSVTRARRNGGDGIDFEVRDSGIGMTEEELGRVLRPFEQGDASSARKFGGSGLGLGIAQGLCAVMAAELAVQSQPGAGSTFTVHLPVRVSRSRTGMTSRHLSVERLR